MIDAAIRGYKNEKAYVASEINRKEKQVSTLKQKYKMLESKIIELEKKKDE
jgi:hypothetical protein